MNYFSFLFILFFFIGNGQVVHVNDLFTNTIVEYFPANKLPDGNLISDESIDGIIYIKKDGKYYQRNMIDNKVNVKWFGAVGDGITDDTSAVQKAIDSGFPVYFPPGIYKINTVISKHVIIEGSGFNTILKPYNINEAIFLYKTKQPYWSYSNRISKMRFESSNKSGIAIAFGNVNLYKKGIEDEYVGNVVFENLNFKNFDKAVFFPFGNIGDNFYNCSFQENKYGVYALNNKFSGDIMHAGNKYFYACEFSSNDVGVYIHNTAVGFGGISFNDIIFQFNQINVYMYSDNTYMPIQFINCWDEKSASKRMVSIDSFNEKVMSKSEIVPFSFYFTGKNSSYIFFGGRINNLKLLGNNIFANAYSSQFESKDGVGAKNSEISENSFLNIINGSSEQGIQLDGDINVIGKINFPDSALLANPISSTYRVFVSDNKKYNWKNDDVITNDLPNNIRLTGTLSNIINNKPNIEINFTTPKQYMRIEESIKKLSKGIYMINFDLKVNKGNPIIFIWDRNKNQLVSLKPVLDNKTHNYTAVLETKSDAEIYFDISSDDGSVVSFQLQNYKIIKAKNFKDVMSWF